MKENQKNHEGQDLKYQLTGWIIFIVCAIFFITASLKNHDILTFIGSAIFLIACLVFLIPLIRIKKKAENTIKLHADKKPYNQANTVEAKGHTADES